MAPPKKRQKIQPTPAADDKPSTNQFTTNASTTAVAYNTRAVTSQRRMESGLGFFGLPRELRDMIYREMQQAYPAKDKVHLTSQPTVRMPTMINLALTNKTICKEILPMFHERNKDIAVVINTSHFRRTKAKTKLPTPDLSRVRRVVVVCPTMLDHIPELELAMHSMRWGEKLELLEFQYRKVKRRNQYSLPQRAGQQFAGFWVKITCKYPVRVKVTVDHYVWPSRFWDDFAETELNRRAMVGVTP